ncbi:MAG TPA: serine/threonine-protein kinase [Polyangiaceae bacterium]|jgi:serine/threonine protein kinase
MLRSLSQAGDCLAGRYQIGGELGRGAGSVVFEATDLSTGQLVALKLLRPEASNASLSKRFLREARLAASIDHASVVRILDSGVAEGMPFLVMERLAGRDLGRFLREQAELPVPLAIELGIELCDALAVVHGAGVLHRDVKPANVLVLDDAAGPRLKLLDFGLARETKASAEELTQEGEVLGSLPYLAPELLFDATRADAASDVYAAICLLHDLLFGRPPFVAESRAALRQAIRFDEPSLPCVRDARLHGRLTALFRRGLAKDPMRRFASATALREELEALEVRRPARLVVLEPTAGIPERFTVERRLGAGAHGEVFAVYDRVLERDLALKRLRTSTPEAVARLEREFRALQGVKSPNLVQVEELFTEGDSAFFTMRLVQGRRLSDTDPAHVDAALLMTDLVAGLGALHARGLVHRDLKPSNVLIEPGGRAVIVDLGLALGRGERDAVAGTPPYMAPELLDGKIAPAADLYALGVLVLEFLVGRDRVREVLSVTTDHAALATSARDAPAPLVALCLELVRSDAALRPNVASVLERLQALEQPSERFPSAPARAAELVGRADELAALEDAWRASARRAVVVAIEGEAGIGKSALLGHFAARIADRRETLVLETRCHHAESVPLPALDAAIARLAELLALEERAFLESVKPRAVRALLRFLPALESVPWPLREAEDTALYSDPSELRSQAIDALRELFDGIADRRGILLTLDDVQWLDPDSAAVLRAIVGAARAPRLLVVLTRRPDGAQPTSHPFVGLSAECRHLGLGPLAPHEAVALARRVAAAAVPVHDGDAYALLEPTRGNPYLISLLVGRAAPSQPLTTSEALLAEYRGLAAPARRVLELVSLSPRPIAARTLLRAAAAGDRDLLSALEAKRLIRPSGVSGLGQVEAYHALVSDAVAGALAPEVRVERHSALAVALQQLEPDDERGLVEHLAASGDLAGAARIAVHAAEHARDGLAFASAAALLETALRHAKPEAPERGFLLEKLSLALVEAGRTHDAALALLAASERLPERTATLQQRAGELLLQSGDLKQGLEVLAGALAAHGLVLASPETALAEAFEQFAALLGRGLTYTPRATPQCSSSALERIDLCLSLAQSLTYVDLRCLGFLLRGLVLALDTGENARLQRALALFVAGTASHLPNPLVGPALELCRRLTAELGNAYASVLLLVAEAELAHFEGNFLAAELNCEKGERLLLECCTGATREIADLRIRSLLIQYSQKGDYRSIFPRSSSWLLEAEARQDRFYANWLRAAHALVWVARDQPDKARAELARAEADWSGGAGVFEVAVALYLDVVDRYEGHPQAASRAAQGRSAVLESPASQTPFLQGYLWLHRGWGALRNQARAGNGREEAERAVLQLRGLGLKIWQGAADALEANLAFVGGRREEAIALLERGELVLRELNLLSLAACARKRRGEFTAGALGARLKSEADAQLSELGVAAPDRFAAAYFGPFAIGGASAESDTLSGDRHAPIDAP